MTGQHVIRFRNLTAVVHIVRIRTCSAGLLISIARWETKTGENWNETGVEPDREVRGTGENFAAAAEDQLSKVLEMLESGEGREEAEAA